MSQSLTPLGLGQNPTSDTSYNTQMNNQNKIQAQLLVSLQKIATELATVSIIPAPTAGALGTYVLAQSTITVAFGGSVSGASLKPSNAAGTTVSAVLTGTWTCMGAIGASGDVSLFVRSA